MTAYYNEIDPFAAAWLRNLIAKGMIAPGDVDTRPIQEVQPDDVRGYTQCHFFAGIGGWARAIRLAGWFDDRSIWSGSCPCQPFSCAGKREGEADERHLWPEFYRLIRECRPAILAGEQVASADGLRWLDGVCADLEGSDYAVGAADLCAAGLGAPHIRQRLWWGAVRLDNPMPSGSSPELPDGWADKERKIGFSCQSSNHRRLEHPEGDGRDERRAEPGGRGAAGGCGACGLGDAEGTGSQQRDQAAAPMGHWCASESTACWSDYNLIPCRDGKLRRAQSGLSPLAHGIPLRVGELRARLGELGVDPKTAGRIIRLARRYRTGSLRGYGNAIVPEVGAEFVRLIMEAIDQ